MNTNTRFHKHIKNLAIIIGITMSLHGRLGSLLLQSTTMTNKLIQEMQSLARAKKHRKHINDLRRTAIMEVKVIRSQWNCWSSFCGCGLPCNTASCCSAIPASEKIIHKTEHTKVNQEVHIADVQVFDNACKALQYCREHDSGLCTLLLSRFLMGSPHFSKARCHDIRHPPERCVRFRLRPELKWCASTML